MQETKPLFIINKYRSILCAAIIVEVVNFLVSLTDSIIAGNIIGTDAFAAIGLLAPFASISLFFSSIVNTGTVVNFSYQVGRFDKRRANEFFSQGVIMALLAGVLYILVLFSFGSLFISNLTDNEEMQMYLNEYFYFILLFFMFNPLSYLLDSIVVADSGEKLSAAANITYIVCNVVLSLVFAELWGIKGIAIASVLSELALMLVVCLHFFSKKNTVKFVWHWKRSDFFTIIKGGVSKASTYGLEALLTFSINLFALLYFDEGTLIVLVVVEKFLGLMTMFIGFSMACQPLVGTLRGENNTKGQRLLMRTVLKDNIVASSILTVVLFLGAPLLVKAFGIHTGESYAQAVSAVRIVSSTLILQAILVLFFVYYVFTDKQLLAFIICLIKNFISPVVIAVVLSVILGSNIGIWLGLAVAPALAILFSFLIVYLKYGRENIPFLIPRDKDDRIFIYDFIIDTRTSVEASKTVERLAKDTSVSPNMSVMAGTITEDLLLLIIEKNMDSKKPIRAECTVIREDDGLRLIFRDSGMIFDITDADTAVSSFRQYVIANMMIKQEVKLYMPTTGYNRSEFFFPAEMSR